MEQLRGAIGKEVGTKKAGTDMQDFRSLPNVMSKAQWETWAQLDWDGRLLVLCALAVKLGCRNPSEPTLKRWASLLMVACVDQSELATWNAYQKHGKTTQVSKEFKRILGRMKESLPANTQHPVILPQTFTELADGFPELVGFAYGEDVEVQSPPVDMAAVLELEGSFSCRRDGQTVAPRTVPTLSLHQPQGADNQHLIQAMNQFATGVMKSINQMQEMQCEMFRQMLDGGSGGNGGRGSQTRRLQDSPSNASPGSHSSLAALCDEQSPGLRPRRSSSFQSEASDATGQETEQADNKDGDQQRVASPEHAASPGHAASPEHAVASEEPEDVSERRSSPRTSLTLLGALDDREREKDASKASARAEKKAQKAARSIEEPRDSAAPMVKKRPAAASAVKAGVAKRICSSHDDGRKYLSKAEIAELGLPTGMIVFKLGSRDDKYYKFSADSPILRTRKEVDAELTSRAKRAKRPK